MNFLKTIKEHKLINDSLLPIIFNDLLDDEDYWWEPEYDLPRLTHSISLFYFGLIQCFCFAKAQNEAKKLKDLMIDENIINPVVNIWNVDAPGRFNSIGELFSFFISANNEKTDPLIFSPEFKNQIIEIKKSYEIISSNSRTSLQLISREQFLSFLKSLPLLQITSFNNETMKLEFSLPDKKLSIKASPFISFLSFDSSPFGEPVESATTNCYILTSVSKGQKNDELFFDTLRLDSTDLEKDKKKICRQIKPNENLKLLCQTANIETQWYPIDDCWCDLKFLNKMVNATEKVLLKCCGIKNIEFQSDEDIGDKLLAILDDTELYEAFRSYDQIKASELNDILFNLFLTEGLFKSVRCIVLNPNELKEFASSRIFRLYLDELAESCSIAPESVQEYITQCDNKINTALQKLAHIVSEKSSTYKKRKREIDAEWKTYYILQAAGIKSNSLFADIETILSIDDYYDMIVNNEASAEHDLMQLLRMLCVFYQALLENGSVFDEKKFFSDAERIAPDFNISKHTLESLFESFVQIAKKSESSQEMAELLGRAGVGANAAKYIEFCRDRILESKLSPVSNNYSVSKSNEHAMFISYAHEDLKIVKPIVERWRSLGIDFFFDETDIHHGENWQDIAQKCMDSDKCKIVIAFCSKNSVCKEGVVKELRYAHSLKNQKGCDDFIIPINLVADKPIKEYLHDALSSKDKKIQKLATEIWDYGYIESEASYIDYHKLSSDELDKAVRQDYERLTDSDGRVVAPYRFDEFKLAIANFYAFLKYGEPSSKSYSQIDSYFNNKNATQSKCIYPIVASIKEARIKRDNIAIVGYELIRGKGRQTESNNILTSKILDVDDYYCIPKYRNSEKPGKYMIEPLLIKCDKFLEILAKARGNDNE